MMIAKFFTLSILILLFSKPCYAQSTDSDLKMNPKETKLLIDSISAVLNRWYIYPDRAVLYEKKLNINYKKGIYNKVQTRSDLIKQLSDDLQAAQKDVHLKIGYFPETSKNLELSNLDSVDLAERDAKLGYSRQNHFSFIKKEILPGNIGYLRWDAFDRFVEEALPIYDSAFNFVSKCKVLIIDLRYNLGGRADMEYALQNYFFERRTAMNHLILRSNDTLKKYTNPSKTSFKLGMPIYILTSSKTVSAAEDFTYGLQQVKRALTVGDTTWGGAHTVHYYSLGQGFVISVPSQRSFNQISKTNWEGTGIFPDFATSSDEALEEALLLIYKKLLVNAKGLDEKNKIQHYINEVNNNKYAGIPFSTLKNNDAVNAIEIRDSIFGPTNVALGHGANPEYHVKTPFLKRGAPIYLNEGNSAWFKLSIDKDTLLTFDIVPIDPSNDYDFIFFKCSTKECVDNIKTNKVIPDRACHSGFESFNGTTGLSRHGAEGPVSLGPGPTYVSAIPVKAGEVYYLMIIYADDYVKEGRMPHGFTIYFHDYWPKKKPVVLNNVSFNSNETALLKESFSELDKLVKQLQKDKSMYIEIRGHADSQGSEEKNMELSISRAQAVKDYLISKHIDAKRISCKGFGSSRPLVANETEEGRKKNRRVECALIMR